ncbi:hypothetical protein R5R35_009520 [Gryllus longicercus]|uniref:Dehydrogenase/reductase SDR family member 11 n=1 Tax=Gryllus longicercus TaxID=2509291 RepID=A0AAN9Z4I5_9ORTH
MLMGGGVLPQGAVEAARQEAAVRGRESPSRAPEQGKLHCLKCDVSKEDDIINAFKWVKDNAGGVDILINNAGVVGKAKLTDTDTPEWRRLLDVNVLGLCICTREAIQQMRARGVDDGHVVHISSVAAHQDISYPGMEMYSATKHAVRVLTEGLRKELVTAKSKIRVTEVSPGLVRTEIFETLGIDVEMIWKLPYLFPEDVANSVLYALATPPHVQVHEMILKPLGEE